MNRNTKLRLFLDSNVLMAGFVSHWGLDKAVLSICASNICRLVFAEAVREELEFNLALNARTLSEAERFELMDHYRVFILRCDPERVPHPKSDLVRASRNLIRHEADVPVLLSAIAAKPDWLLTNNTKHFTPEVARRTGLRIATPHQFFTTISSVVPT